MHLNLVRLSVAWVTFSSHISSNLLPGDFRCSFLLYYILQQLFLGEIFLWAAWAWEFWTRLRGCVWWERAVSEPPPHRPCVSDQALWSQCLLKFLKKTQLKADFSALQCSMPGLKLRPQASGASPPPLFIRTTGGNLFGHNKNKLLARFSFKPKINCKC